MAGAKFDDSFSLLPGSSLKNPLISGVKSDPRIEVDPDALYGCLSSSFDQGIIPTHAITDHPQGRPLVGTFFADTPAPFECPCCGFSGLSVVRSSLSTAAVMAAAVTVVGVCFLAPGSALWHKHHYCPACKQKVGEYRKDDIFLVADPMCWRRISFAIPVLPA